MKLSPSVKTALSLGLLLGVLGVGAVGVAQYLRGRQGAAPEMPTSGVTPPASLPTSAPNMGIVAGEPVPGASTAVISAFLLAGTAAPTAGASSTDLLEQMARPGGALSPSDRYAVGPSWVELMSDKRLWTGHPIQDGQVYAGGSPGFDERSNGKEFYA